MKITTAIAALLFCTAALASTPHKYRLVWQDHFDGNTYDYLSWSKIPRGNADWKRHMSDADSLYAVRDGRLVLRGAVNTHRDADTARYVTGGLYTKHKRTIRHGKVEVRAKFGSAQGAWPAIWMLPDAEIKWPEGGEIDIMEHLNHDTIAYQVRINFVKACQVFFILFRNILQQQVVSLKHQLTQAFASSSTCLADFVAFSFNVFL